MYRTIRIHVYKDRINTPPHLGGSNSLHLADPPQRCFEVEKALLNKVQHGYGLISLC